MNFIEQIENFKKNGTYNYQFDEAGNQILNPSSSIFQNNYLSFPLNNYVYNVNKILSFYDPEIMEFKPTAVKSNTTLPQDVMDKISEITLDNTNLQNRLTDLIAKSETNSTDADKQAIKDIILQLRIDLGQGSSINDFYLDFPYLPIPLEKKNVVI